jgi:hypothetical protein
MQVFQSSGMSDNIDHWQTNYCMSDKSKMNYLNTTNNGRSSSLDQSQPAEVALADPSLKIDSERSNMTNNARAASDLISQTTSLTF